MLTGSICRNGKAGLMGILCRSGIKSAKSEKIIRRKKTVQYLPGEGKIYRSKGSGGFCKSGRTVSLCDGFKQGQRGSGCQVPAGDPGSGAESGGEFKHLCR